jgi:hypothetical protein
MEWAIIVSGWVTALAGLAACIWPEVVFGAFGIVLATKANWFFIRHWGFLIFAVGMLIALDADKAVLLAGALEKFLLVGMIIWGTIPRTRLMTLVAFVDGAFAIMYMIALMTR